MEELLDGQIVVDHERHEMRCVDEEGGTEVMSLDSVEGALLYNALKGTIELEVIESPSGLTYYRPIPRQ
jgi:hypothetical protein